MAVWASLGISRFPDDALLVEQLMLIADTRMYEAKRAHRPRTTS